MNNKKKSQNVNKKANESQHLFAEPHQNLIFTPMIFVVHPKKKKKKEKDPYGQAAEINTSRQQQIGI